MDSSQPAPLVNASRTSRRRRTIGWAAVVVAIGLYGVLLAMHTGAWAGGSDSSGYLNNARLIRAGKLHESRRVLEGIPAEKLPMYTYVPLGFMPDQNLELVPTYPMGLSLFMVAVSPFTGWPLAPHATMWLHAMAGVVLMTALGRTLGLSLFASLLGALILALSPLYLLMSLQAMSDVPALVWCSAAVWFAWLSRKNTLWALAAGASIALAVLVRPSNLLIIVPVSLCLGGSWRRWLWLGLGGLPGAVFFGLVNLALYGKAITTGYGDVSGAFSFENVVPTLTNYAQWLPVCLTPGVLLALALPWLTRRETRLIAAVLAAWVLPFLGFYLFYYYTHETWWYLRFVLPAFPALILAALLAGQHFATKWNSRTLRMARIIVPLAVLGWAVYWNTRLSIMDAGHREKVYPDSARWARAHLPPNSVILSMQMTGALLYHTNLTFLRSDQFDQRNFGPIEQACQAAGRPIYAILFPFETKDVLETRLPGRWKQVGAVQHVSIWERTAEVTTAPIIPWQTLVAGRVGETDLIARCVEGWYDRESDLRHNWRWSRDRAVLELETWPQETRRVQLTFGLRTAASTIVTVKQGATILLRREIGRTRVPVDLTIEVTRGRARLEFSTESPGVVESPGPEGRILAFAVYNPRLTAREQP